MISGRHSGLWQPNLLVICPGVAKVKGSCATWGYVANKGPSTATKRLDQPLIRICRPGIYSLIRDLHVDSVLTGARNFFWCLCRAYKGPDFGECWRMVSEVASLYGLFKSLNLNRKIVFQMIFRGGSFDIYLATNQGVVGSIPASRTK